MLNLYRIAAGITIAVFVKVFGQIVQSLSSVSLIFPSAVFLSPLVSLPSFWCLSLWLTLCASFCDWSATDELLCGVAFHLVTVLVS